MCPWRGVHWDSWEALVVGRQLMRSDAIDDGWLKWEKHNILICHVVRFIPSALMRAAPNLSHKET